MQFLPVLLRLLVAALPQLPPGAHVVSGTVFDSIGSVPLAGAVVQVTLLDSTGRTSPGSAPPRVFTAVTDTGGRYRLSGLPAGHFAIGFQHDALNVLGLETPLRAFDLDRDSSVTVDLAIPGGPAVRAALCGRQTRLAAEGLLVGYVVDARREGMLPGAVVRVRWLELALERGNYRTVTRTVTAIVGEDGRYLACGVTSEEAATVTVSMPGYRSIVHRLAVPADGAARRDFRMADSGAVRGAGSVTGRAVRPDGSTPTTGQVVVAALALQVAIRNGEFFLPDLPAGTWSVEAREIGNEPGTALVDVPVRGTVPMTIALGERAQVLDAITVKGRRGDNQRILNAIASRRSTSTGTVFLPDDPYLASSYDPADVVRTAPGFRYVSAEVLLASGCGFRYPPRDEPTMPSGTARTRTRTLAVYLDGARVIGGLPELRTTVTMRDILAIEAYQDIATAPLEWRTHDACAVLAIWTKR